MVTMKKCSVCNHDVDNHIYSVEDTDTVRGKERCTTSRCSVKDCNCYEQSLQRFKDNIVNQKEHG
jgi:hypothetical protein